jgi:hypothetical protein
MTSEAPASVHRAMDLLRRWMVQAGPEFWPQEQTLQDWLAAAFVEGGLCPHATNIVAEVALGETERDLGHLRHLIQAGTPSSTFLYDLVVLKGRARGQARSFESVRDPGISLVVQLKALNSAGTMDRADLRQDVKTLWVAREYERRKGNNLDTLFVVLATSCKDEDGTKAATRIRWLRDRFEEVTGDVGAADFAGGIPMALVLADEVLLRTTTGTWQPEG